MLSTIIDSGAFTAYTQKKTVNVKAYCDFIAANQQYIAKAINLDVINPQGPEKAAEAGWDNYLYALDRGLDVMPVFHAREQVKWLDKMLDKTNYVGLSGTSLVSPLEDKQWHRTIWNYVTDQNGCPIANFHSFGNTSMYVLLTFPFFSADSATWMIQSGRAARVRLQGKAYQFRSGKIKDTSYVDINDPLPKKQAWQEEIRSFGLDPDAVMSVKATPTELAMIRSYLVASDILRLEEQTASCTRYKLPIPLIGNKRQMIGGQEREGPCRIHFVISPSAYSFNFPLVATLGIKKVLVSYFYIATSPKGFWQEKLLPFLLDPLGYCLSGKDKKVFRFYSKLQEVLDKSSHVVGATV